MSTQVDAAGNALEVVLDVDNFSVNYYRGNGTCVGYMQPIGVCEGPISTSPHYGDEDSCIQHGQCIVDDGTTPVIHGDKTQNECDAMADLKRGMFNPLSRLQTCCCCFRLGD